MNATVYSDFAKDGRGWFFGLSGAQLAVVVAGGIPELVAINAGRWWLVAAWVPAWALVAALVTVPVRGRPAARWIFDLALHCFGGVMGWTRWQSAAAAGTATAWAQADLPGVLAGVRTHDGPPHGPGLSRIALVQDTAARTWAAVARIVHPGIGLAEQADRDRMAAGLAEMCEVAARTRLLDLVAIQVRTVPDDGAERAAWQAAHRRAGAPALARQVNQALGATLGAAAVRTETFVTLVVAEDRIRRLATEFGGGLDGRARVLYQSIGEIEHRLRGAIGCTEVTWLDSAGLAVAIRTGFAPGDRAALVAADLAAHHAESVAAGVPMAAAGPTRAASEARHYAHDAWASVTDTILLPDHGAVLGALAPVLAPSVAGERRALTVFYQVLPQQAAERLVGREEMSAATGNALRARVGLLSRARHRRANAQVVGMDEQLARGRALVRPAAAASVTVPATWPVAEAGGRLDAAIRAAGFIPLRLDLAQDSAFAAACIPLGIGLPRSRRRR